MKTTQTNSSSEEEQKNAARLSVIILTYNSAYTLRSCLDSLINQKNHAFSVMIVDDDSTDETLKIVNSYKVENKLQIDIVLNGTHNISKGRNIGCANSVTDYIAYIDSDDQAENSWTEVIIKTFDNDPSLGFISGHSIFSSTNSVGKAIAFNDGAVDRFFGKGIVRFCAGNSAFNKRIVRETVLFDEDFIYAEDLEIASRLQRKYRWLSVAGMKIFRNSRTDFREYASQMYRYGIWKFYYGFVEKDYRLIDFVPLAIILISIILAALLRLWSPLSLLVLFSLAESLFVLIAIPGKPSAWPLSFPAWLIKNLYWSMGIAYGMVSIHTDKELRSLLKGKRILHQP